MYIFDLDQTLADIKHRIHHILKEKPDWDSFYKEVPNDTPIEDNCKLIRDLEIMDVVVILTGRSEQTLKDTQKWLNKNKIIYDYLIMREVGDHRPDHIVKPELLNKFLLKYNKYKEDVKVIFEDKKSMVDMWRALGYTCHQVCKGDY